MSTPVSKRKRARKACIPCHQRKRKCDAKFPCGMCTTYEYSCKYDEDELPRHAPTPKRVTVEGGTSIANRTSASAATTPASTFDEHGYRYAGAAAAMAFPHILGTALGSAGSPEMHSSPYNFGIRSDEASYSHGLLGELISEEDLTFFSGVFFSTMALVADFVEPQIYARRCREYFHGSGNAIAFGAVAAGIAALGSFLSPSKHPRESDLVQYAKDILDDPATMRLLGIDHIIAWGMRVFYLRATSRPNSAWIASCTIMHLCEAVGLHIEENIIKMGTSPGAAAIGHDTERLRRIFWISWAGHNMLSYEYDRSSVRFRTITCQAATSSSPVSDHFVQLCQIIPVPESPFQLEFRTSTPREDLLERLKVLQKLPITDPFLVVTKADLAFCFFRRVYQGNMGITDEIIQIVIDNGNAALGAAEKLASQGNFFWNVIGSVFQYTCILLAIDTPAASVHITAAFKGLEDLVKAADTGMTREALGMARHLLSLTTARKQKELTRLQALEGSYQPYQAQPNIEVSTSLPDMDWGLEWDQFLMEPYLSMLGPNV